MSASRGIFAALLAASAFAACSRDRLEPTEDVCGDLRSSTGRVVGGEAGHDPSVVDLSPAQVNAVGAILVTITDVVILCTATLVGPDVILTSAHCVPADTVGIEFRTGTDLMDPAATFDAVSWVRHPLYDDMGGGAPDHDLAVAILGGDTASAGIEPILVNDAYMSILGQDVQAVGYGGTAEPGNTSRYWTVQQVALELPFAYSISDGGLSGLCPGDSGGPLLYTVPGSGVRVMGTASSISDGSCLGASNFSRTDTSMDWLEPLVPTGPCLFTTFTGHCDGDMAIWCEAGEVVTEDCSAFGMQCGPDGEGLMRCVPMCGVETFAGRCDGDTAIWCEADEVVTEDCAGHGMVCALLADGTRRCTDECTALGLAGACVGETARWCEDGVIRQRDCALCEQICDLVGEPLLAYCL